MEGSVSPNYVTITVEDLNEPDCCNPASTAAENVADKVGDKDVVSDPCPSSHPPEDAETVMTDDEDVKSTVENLVERVIECVENQDIESEVRIETIGECAQITGGEDSAEVPEQDEITLPSVVLVEEITERVSEPHTDNDKDQPNPMTLEEEERERKRIESDSMTLEELEQRHQQLEAGAAANDRTDTDQGRSPAQDNDDEKLDMDELRLTKSVPTKTESSSNAYHRGRKSPITSDEEGEAPMKCNTRSKPIVWGPIPPGTCIRDILADSSPPMEDPGYSDDDEPKPRLRRRTTRKSTEITRKKSVEKKADKDELGNKSKSATKDKDQVPEDELDQNNDTDEEKSKGRTFAKRQKPQPRKTLLKKPRVLRKSKRVRAKGGHDPSQDIEAEVAELVADCQALVKLQTPRLMHNDMWFTVGDIVSVKDEDGDRYFAQIKYFLSNKYCKHHVCIRWLIPIPHAHTSFQDEFQFLPENYVTGPDQPEPIDMDSIVFEMNVPTFCGFDPKQFHVEEHGFVQLNVPM